MPYITSVPKFVARSSEWRARCLILQTAGREDGVYGFFIADPSASAVAESSVINSLFTPSKQILSDPITTQYTPITLPLCNFVGLYPVTILIKRHNSVVDVYDGQNLPIDAYLGVGT